MTFRERAAAAAFIFLATLGSVWPASAISCPPGVPHFRYVGDTNPASPSYDKDCTDNDIQSAIDNSACPTTIVVTHSHTYGNQHLTVSGKTISILGQTDGVSCGGAGGTTGGGSSSPIITPQLVITGDSGHSALVIDSSNSNITLRFLELTGGGGDSGSHGGGINFGGSGSLTLDTVTVDLNTAGNGGGIEFNGSGGNAILTLDAYSVIESNTASGNGGGINIEGSAQLMATAPFTFVGFNHAPNGNGGGIAVVGPATASIGSPGYEELPVLDGNNAEHGGGLSAQALGGEHATIILFTTDPNNPVTLSGNLASNSGGGVYLKPFAGPSFGIAFLCARDFHIDGNSAPEGSAVFADFDTSLTEPTVGAGIYLDDVNDCGQVPAAVPCAKGISCNTLNGNSAKDSDNNPTPGSVILVQQYGSLTARGVTLLDNTGLHAIRLIDPGHDNDNPTTVFATVATCLIANNTLSAERISIEDQGNQDGTLAVIDSCTIANNGHTSGSAIRAEHTLTLTNSIIDEPFMSTLSKGSSATITSHNILASDPTGLAAAADIVPGEPLFVDAAAGDYRQVATTLSASLGIDFAQPITGDDRDLDGNPYDQDIAQITNRFGDRDLGCYEAQPITDRIFADALGDPLSLVK